MECQDVRQLLAFFERKSEELDAVERDALRKHLDACPDCAALSAQERGIDQSLGAAMRDVAIPAGLKQQVLQRLAKERGGKPWKRWAAAAVLFLAIGGGISFFFWPKPAFNLPVERNNWTQRDVQQYLDENGLAVTAPSRIKYGFLRQVDIVLIQGRPVARLTFNDGGGGPSATVFIVDRKQFHIDDFNDPSVHKDDDGQFSYIYYCPGGIDWLRPDVF
jgi:hypothetical protein